jgi:hypothetical protein
MCRRISGRIPRLIVIAFVALHLTHSAASGQGAASGNDVQTARSRPDVGIRISEETTKITAPVSEDGYVDYTTALDELSRKGVTAKNNLAVPLIAVFGKEEIPQDVRKEYLRQRGFTTASLKRQEFELLPDWMFEREVREVLWALARGPWDGAQHPRIAKWFSTNQDLFQLLERVLKLHR